MKTTLILPEPATNSWAWVTHPDLGIYFPVKIEVNVQSPGWGTLCLYPKEFRYGDSPYMIRAGTPESWGDDPLPEGSKIIIEV